MARPQQRLAANAEGPFYVDRSWEATLARVRGDRGGEP